MLRGNFATFQNNYAGLGLGGTKEQPHMLMVRERAFGRRADFEARVETRGRLIESFVTKHHAALHFDPFGAAQIDGYTLAEAGTLDRFVMHLERTDPHFVAARKQAQALSDCHLRADRGACDDGAVALDGKDPVEGQAKQTSRATAVEALKLAGDRITKLVKSSAVKR
jgi:hypothetical protein